MAECDRMEQCTFINSQLTAMPALAEMLKKKYCLGNCEECVRYKLEKNGVSVPMDLFPDDEKAAQTLFRLAG